MFCKHSEGDARTKKEHSTLVLKVPVAQTFGTLVSLCCLVGFSHVTPVYRRRKLKPDKQRGRGGRGGGGRGMLHALSLVSLRASQLITVPGDRSGIDRWERSCETSGAQTAARWGNYMDSTLFCSQYWHTASSLKSSSQTSPFQSKRENVE